MKNQSITLTRLIGGVPYLHKKRTHIEIPLPADSENLITFAVTYLQFFFRQIQISNIMSAPLHCIYTPTKLILNLLELSFDSRSLRYGSIKNQLKLISQKMCSYSDAHSFKVS